MVRGRTQKGKTRARKAQLVAASRSYDKPPVREALIDIRVSPLPASVLPALENLHETLRPQYPVKKVKHYFEGSIRIRGADLTTSQSARGPIGYIYCSEDGKQMVQLRLDGFTFNRLKPEPEEAWLGWESLRSEAERVWSLYVATTEIQEVTRLGVRYINQIVVRRPQIELNDYFTAAPQVPKSLPYQDFGNYLSRIELDIRDAGAKAIITQAPAPEHVKGAMVLILDIDVFKQERFPIEGVSLWQALDQLRDIKNTIFEAGLHEKTKKLFMKKRE